MKAIIIICKPSESFLSCCYRPLSLLTPAKTEQESRFSTRAEEPEEEEEEVEDEEEKPKKPKANRKFWQHPLQELCEAEERIECGFCFT